jgi:hypothetical protein
LYAQGRPAFEFFEHATAAIQGAQEELKQVGYDTEVVQQCHFFRVC